ncbi:hypothetical protein V7S43_016931 [Phytophthora oleae]|uniref:DUF676 domain-containing protein n=1 Tax=Phytophthora oleae TaxID=2107226 RepID=A0ABD3EUF8_9STRA
MAAPLACFLALVWLVLHVATAETSPVWPVLQLQFSVKRSSMGIFGRSNFSMMATPVASDDATQVLYDVFATFTHAATVYNYTVVNGKASLSSSGGALESATKCLKAESEVLPPVNSIVAALNQATAILSIPRDFQCSSDNLFKISVNSIDFAVCATGTSGFTMHSSDLDVQVVYSWDYPGILSNTAVQECAAITQPTRITPIGHSLLTGTPLDHGKSRKLAAAFDFSWGDSSCKCKSTPRPCIFIHGLGIKTELSKNQDSFEDYWGDDLPKHAPCCSSMKFAVLNTETSAWTDEKLQQKVCDRILTVGKTKSKSKISDTIIVAHSMGNLIFAGAIATGKCRLDTKTSTWVGLSGPMGGSMASDYFQSACEDQAMAVVQQYVDIIGMCPIRGAVRSMANESGNYSSVVLNKAYVAAQKVYQKNVDAVMCSGNGSGLVSLYQVKFWLMHRLVPFKSKENDGMVEFDSCSGGLLASKFGNTWQSRFYKSELNHYDTTFRAGDGLFNKAKMPLKWFECLL